MATSNMIHVRVGQEVTAEATETLPTMGLSTSNAVCEFLALVVAALRRSFAVGLPNAATRAAMREADAIARTRRGVSPLPMNSSTISKRIIGQ